MPISVTLTPEHHEKLKKNVCRLGISRADFVALLIEYYADQLERYPPDATTYICEVCSHEKDPEVKR